MFKSGEINELESNFCINCGNNLKLSHEKFNKNIDYMREVTEDIDLWLGDCLIYNVIYIK